MLSERLAAVSALTEYTFARALQRYGLLTHDRLDSSDATPRRAPPSSAINDLACRGFVAIHDILDAELAAQLNSHITAQIASATGTTRPSNEHPSGSLLPPALEPQHRSDVLLDIFEPLVSHALAAALLSPVGELLHACLGPDALLWELSAMRASPGAQTQPIHPDTRWRSEEVCARNSQALHAKQLTTI